MLLNEAGLMVEKQWLQLPNRFNNIRTHEFVVMPNHFHAILEIVDETTIETTTDEATDEATVAATLVVARNQNNTS